MGSTSPLKGRKCLLAQNETGTRSPKMQSWLPTGVAFWQPIGVVVYHSPSASCYLSPLPQKNPGGGTRGLPVLLGSFSEATGGSLGAGGTGLKEPGAWCGIRALLRPYKMGEGWLLPVGCLLAALGKNKKHSQSQMLKDPTRAAGFELRERGRFSRRCFCLCPGTMKAAATTGPCAAPTTPAARRCSR